jgi:hypothetical protein
MPYMTWASLLNSPQAVAAGTALASSTSLTDISVAPQFTLPANFLQAGSALRFTAFGVFSTTATPTLLVGVYYGAVAGTALAATTAFTTPSGVTNVPWRLELETTIRSVGTSGTAMSQGFFQYGASVSALQATLPLPQIALATTTVDTTAAKVLSIGAQWGTNSASNTITLHGFRIYSDGL